MWRREEAGVADSGEAAKADGPEAYAKTSQEITRHAFDGWKTGILQQGPRDLLHRTDQLLWELEMLNLAGCGRRRLPSGLRDDVVSLEGRLSLEASNRLDRCRTVQDHLEAIFEVQEHLLRACVAHSLGDLGRQLLLAPDDDG
ncbi:MAG: hypothetical protein J2P57_24380 [Acidimicrobiaceae bacterium]|nr:hypothetical protein [Acidimicrobiaceae bacterium]